MGSSYLGEDEGGEYCETCYGRPGDVSKKTHERELASLRAEVERLRGEQVQTFLPRCTACQERGFVMKQCVVCGGSGFQPMRTALGAKETK